MTTSHSLSKQGYFIIIIIIIILIDKLKSQINFSLVIPQWVSTMSTRKNVNRHTTCTRPVSMILQRKLVSGWGLRNRDSTTIWTLWLRKTYNYRSKCDRNTCVSWCMKSLRIMSTWFLLLCRIHFPRPPRQNELFPMTNLFTQNTSKTTVVWMCDIL